MAEPLDYATPMTRQLRQPRRIDPVVTVLGVLQGAAWTLWLVNANAATEKVPIDVWFTRLAWSLTQNPRPVCWFGVIASLLVTLGSLTSPAWRYRVYRVYFFSLVVFEAGIILCLYVLARTQQAYFPPQPSDDSVRLVMGILVFQPVIVLLAARALSPGLKMVGIS